MHLKKTSQEVSTEILKDLKQIPKGSFLMGSDMAEVDFCVKEWSSKLLSSNYTKEKFKEWILKEYPQRLIAMDPFQMMKYPIVNRQFAAFVYEAGIEVPESIKLQKPDDHPVWGMPLAHVYAFIEWLNSNSEFSFRLPREQEWEYAAKGPMNNRYPFGNVFNSKYCNTYESGIGDTTSVTEYQSYCSGFGICDLAGNVEEWTSCTYFPYPGGTFIDDDLVASLGISYPITRGGSFNRGGDLARSARRHGPFPSDDYKYIGFRLVA
jgi:toxoflavin biosynthesis protein ToxD